MKMKGRGSPGHHQPQATCAIPGHHRLPRPSYLCPYTHTCIKQSYCLHRHTREIKNQRWERLSDVMRDASKEDGGGGFSNLNEWVTAEVSLSKNHIFFSSWVLQSFGLNPCVYVSLFPLIIIKASRVCLDESIVCHPFEHLHSWQGRETGWWNPCLSQSGRLREANCKLLLRDGGICRNEEINSFHSF